MCGRSNVCTNPLTKPQSDPNGDSKRIEAIEEANQQYPEAWFMEFVFTSLV